MDKCSSSNHCVWQLYFVGLAEFNRLLYYSVMQGDHIRSHDESLKRLHFSGGAIKAEEFNLIDDREVVVIAINDVISLINRRRW